MSVSKKRKKRSGTGAVAGTLVGGAVGTGVGIHKAKKVNIINSIRNSANEMHRGQREHLRRQSRYHRRQAEFMNTFNIGGSRSQQAHWSFRDDPKVTKAKAGLDSSIRSLKNNKGIIAKWAIPPAVVGGVVGHFLEKKAEGEIQMTKADGVMEKLAAGG